MPAFLPLPGSNWRTGVWSSCRQVRWRSSSACRGQRLQGYADAANPQRQCRARRRHALACGDLLDPVQRQMDQVLAGRYPGQQARCGQAAVGDGGRDRRPGDGVAGAAGILRSDVTMHEEVRWFHVQLLADVFTDLFLESFSPSTGGVSGQYRDRGNMLRQTARGCASAPHARARLKREFGDGSWGASK